MISRKSRSLRNAVFDLLALGDHERHTLNKRLGTSKRRLQPLPFRKHFNSFFSRLCFIRTSFCNTTPAFPFKAIQSARGYLTSTIYARSQPPSASISKYTKMASHRDDRHAHSSSITITSYSGPLLPSSV
ncbi:hypothetical protein CC2G_013743 [Coprinopsis cinerea AmutBmut pab1-1]|nr:hypothetical protein CC2G_013743 [Coprinopsis cinerea AmutBmut pab1-1]